MSVLTLDRVSVRRSIAVVALAALCATLGVATAQPARADETASVVFTVSLDGELATGGCVGLFRQLWDQVVEVCEDGESAITIADVTPGDYRVYLSGFAGAADMWLGGGSGAFSGTALTVVEGENNVSVPLSAPSSISGTATAADVDIPGDVIVSLYDENLRYVNSMSPEADGDWGFGALTAGDYFVHYEINADHRADAWYEAPGDWEAVGGMRSRVAASPESPVYLDWFPSEASAELWATFNAPKWFTSDQICIAAYNADFDTTPAAWQCGYDTDWMSLTGLTVGTEYKLRVVNATQMADANAWEGFSGQSAWWGTTSTNDYVVWLDADRPWGYVPLYLFKDVNANTTGFYEISWMGDAGISTGYGDGTYKPNAKVIRQDMARFLYRIAGSPGVTAPAVSPFRDVKTTDAAYEAIYWLKQEGITTVNPFEPKDNVTRRQMALFLYRQAGSPSVTLPSKSPFKDVKKTDSAYKAMVWMKKEGISTGYADGTYKPNADVLRGHMGMFLYRFSMGEH